MPTKGTKRIMQLERERCERLEAALLAMLQAYAPNADWEHPEQLHSAVVKAGIALGKVRL